MVYLRAVPQVLRLNLATFALGSGAGAGRCLCYVFIVVEFGAGS